MREYNGYIKAKAIGSEDLIAMIRETGLLEFGIEKEAIADKWERVIAERAQQTNPIRVVAGLNNADRNGALLALLKDNAEKVLDGMCIAAHAIEADEKWLYLPEGCVALGEAISDAAKECGIEIQYGIINRRESKGGAFHHIETMLALSEILTDSYEPGTYVAVCPVSHGKEAVTGPIKKVAFGTKVSDILKEAGIADDIQAIAVGTKLCDASAAETVIEKETAVGNGVITVYDNTCCLVHESEKVLLDGRKQSCGKCTFCREGLIQLHTMVREITEGKGKKEFLPMIQEIGEAMAISTPCTMGQTGADFVLGGLANFAGEFEEHIRKKCAHEVCEAFQTIYIDPKKCTGCGLCIEACPVKDAITGKPGYVHMLDAFAGVKAGEWMDACPEGAIIKTSGRVPKLPNKLTRASAKPAPGSAGEAALLAAGGAATAGGKGEAKKASRRIRRSSAALLAASQSSQAAAEAGVSSISGKKKKVTKPRVFNNTDQLLGGGKIMKKMEADVIIAGGGPAGLAAAVTAGENNLTSIIFEKTNTTGGAANMGMGPLGIDTHIQKKLFNNITVQEALDEHMRYTHFQVDSDLVQTYFNKSADTISWLEDYGVEFAGAFRYFKESAATWHIVKPENGVIGPRAAGPMARTLAEKAQEMGTTICLETSMKSLIVEDGRVVGMIAVDKDGNEIEARGKAVVVATGGFGNNEEMLRDEFDLNLWKDFWPFRIPAHQGEGLQGMWDIGAERYGANLEIIYQLADNMNWFLLDAVLRQPNLLINQRGDRFMNEQYMGNTTYTGNAIRQQPGKYAYCILDDAIINYYKQNGPDIFDIVHPEEAFFAVGPEFERAVAEGYDGYFEADTIEELAEKIGIDPDKLQETFDEYNQMCEEGRDGKFHKNPDFLHPIYGKGKYRCGKFFVAAYGSIGGVRINKYCEVMGADQEPIPGLYACGNDSNIIYGDSYNFTLCGNSMGFAVNSGRMAGEAIAEYIEDMGL